MAVATSKGKYVLYFYSVKCCRPKSYLQFLLTPVTTIGTYAVILLQKSVPNSRLGASRSTLNPIDRGGTTFMHDRRNYSGGRYRIAVAFVCLTLA